MHSLYLIVNIHNSIVFRCIRCIHPSFFVVQCHIILVSFAINDSVWPRPNIIKYLKISLDWFNSAAIVCVPLCFWFQIVCDPSYVSIPRQFICLCCVLNIKDRCVYIKHKNNKILAKKNAKHSFLPISCIIYPFISKTPFRIHELFSNTLGLYVVKLEIQKFWLGPRLFTYFF